MIKAVRKIKTEAKKIMLYFRIPTALIYITNFQIN